MDLPKLLDENELFTKERREEIKKLLMDEFLGTMPSDLNSEFEIVRLDENFYGGKAVFKEVKAKLSKGKRKYSFNFKTVYPKGITRKLSSFLCLTFTDAIAEGMGEELTDEGYYVASVNYNDIEPDVQVESFEGLQGFCEEAAGNRWGKIGVWAYGASRIIDYLEKESNIDVSKIAVAGHSRLGLAAGWCGALDERVALTICNNNGSLYRETKKESYKDLSREYTRYWFCKNAFRDGRSEKDIPFDMHFMHALIAPRHLYLAGASEDEWADAEAIKLSAIAATPAFKALGVEGFVDEGREGERVISYHKGNIGYHLRFGTHYFGRDDWREVMRYRREQDC